MNKSPHLFLLLILTLLNCSGPAPANDKIPKHETITLDSKILGEKRVINVWLPPQYQTNLDSINVLYMADGGIKEDFPHIANTLDTLIQTKKIAPVMLVGIENTQRRRDLTGATAVATDKEIAPIVGGANAFRSFVEEELFPLVEQRYWVNKNRSIIGESLAGLFVVETLFLKPEMFDNYIAFDPSLWWNDHHLVKTAAEHLNKFPSSPKKFWFASSSAEDIFPHTKSISMLLSQNSPQNLSWNYSDEPKEEHQTIFRATKRKALIWTLGTP